MELKFEKTFGYYTAKVNDDLMYFIEYDNHVECYKLYVKQDGVQNHITGGQNKGRLTEIAQNHFDKNFKSEKQ